MDKYFHALIAFDPKYALKFTDFYFWAFFAAVMIFFSLLHKKRVARSTFLFAISLFFYWKTSGLFFLLLVFSTIIDYYIGLKLAKTETTWKRKSLVGLSVFSNLGILVYFKYAFFFTDSYNKIFSPDSPLHVVNWLAKWSNGIAGTDLFRVDDILLPVGVSFFTFQTISYSIDVYRRQVGAVKNILDFGFYVSYFPQLVAGPIVRASEFIPQIYQQYKLTRYEFGLAIFWILNGLIKKMVLADYLAENFVDDAFQYPENYTGFGVFSALFFYSLQVYGDFSGYTDIAIGVAMLMGFRLPTNFNSPYKAKNVSEFWRRWHMSLSTWLKDYLYIPLGGNKKGTFGTFFWTIVIILFVVLISDNPGVYAVVSLLTIILFGTLAYLIKDIRRAIITNINLMITMVLGGLWHGASWNFVIWGALNGIALVAFKSWNKISPVSKTSVFSGFLILFTAYVYLYPFMFMGASQAMNLSTYLGGINWNMFMLVVCLSLALPFLSLAVIKWLRKQGNLLTIPWGIFITFVFISFTRLFFRAGDRKNTGNQMETVERMWTQLMTNWNGTAIDSILTNLWPVYLVFAIGMIIHWLPVKVKEWYRNLFIESPVFAKIAIVTAVVFFVFQMASGEQGFIYFQF